MAATKFTPQMRGDLVERFAAGLSVRDAAGAVGLNEKTLKTWLTKGRKQKDGDYAAFVEQVEEARQIAKNRPEPMDEEELAVVVSEAARAGNTQAMKLRWEMLGGKKPKDAEEPSKPADPLEALDELAQKRAVRAG